MCGLTGFLSPMPLGAGASDIVTRMAESLQHRGPDDAGIWVDREAGIALGHRRLAVLDLSPAGHQPMLSPCGRYAIVFNGEIYNHQVIRSELEAAGRAPNWRGRSDTETLLAGITAWGLLPTIERSVGMFAIALWDRRERRLHLVRDRFGEKPVYYGWLRGAFVFGSELKALRRHPGFDSEIDRNALSLYARFAYVPAPYSIYRRIYKLEPGCALSLSPADAVSPSPDVPAAPIRRGGFVVERYWSLADVAARGIAEPINHEVEALDRLESALGEAARLQSIADVPLGAFLSGGIDSSTVVALMQTHADRPVRSFSIGFEEREFDEARYAKAVAAHLRTDHTEIYVSARQALDLVPRLPDIYCEPFADSSQIPTYLVAQMACRHVTVALTGDAGDELFGGYNRHRWAAHVAPVLRHVPGPTRRLLARAILAMPEWAWDQVGRIAFRAGPGIALAGKARKIAQALYASGDIEAFHDSVASEWHDCAIVPRARPPALAHGWQTVSDHVTDPQLRAMLRDALTYLPDDLLHKVDRAAMAVSLETRTPYLDHRVAELAWRLPLRMKLRNGTTKWALRQLLYRHLPSGLVERPKSGFAVPLGEWLRGPLRDWAEDLLRPARLSTEGYFDSRLVQQAWQRHLSGAHDRARALWPVLIFQAWLRQESVL